jgi:hypothetical protein
MHQRSQRILLAAARLPLLFKAADLAHLAYLSEGVPSRADQRRATMRTYSFLRSNPALFQKEERGLWRVKLSEIRGQLGQISNRLEKKRKLLNKKPSWKKAGIPKQWLSRHQGHSFYDLLGRQGTTQSFYSADVFYVPKALTDADALGVLFRHGLHFADRLARHPNARFVIYLQLSARSIGLQNDLLLPFKRSTELPTGETKIAIQRAFNHAFSPWKIHCSIAGQKNWLELRISTIHPPQNLSRHRDNDRLLFRSLVEILQSTPDRTRPIREILEFLPNHLLGHRPDYIESQTRVLLTRHKDHFKSLGKSRWKLISGSPVAD